jgi:glutamine phosphoribosylpyrophosphate amidotransferase
MCNINTIVKRKDSKNSYVDRLNFATAHSYAENPDADGIYCDFEDTLLKQGNKINFGILSDIMDKSRFIISHQRFTTSGKGIEMAHPFTSKRFVLVHNGVISHVEEYKAEKSDTCKFFKDFLKEFDKETNIKSAIQKAIDKTCGGSFSVFIYDKYDKIGYYFKNSMPDINFYALTDGDLYITTNNENHLFFSIHKKLKISDNILYEIMSGEKVMIRAMGKISFCNSFSSYFSKHDNFAKKDMLLYPGDYYDKHDSKYLFG